ncbi:MAG: tetratricopeptide repeat protein, partial [Candidatus Latescibacterota bacterium]
KATMSIGTASYMSPEQGRGDAVDQRTDIWSLGVVLYEILTGELPFNGDYDHAVVYSLLNETPIDITRLRPEVPLELEAIVNRSLRKDPDARYQNACEVLAHLKSVGRPPVGGAITATALRPSIAVLPFADLSPEQDQEYFCDGIAEEIINALTRIDGLRVVSRTSAFSFKGRNVDIRDIGKKLNVETVLEGSVRKAGKRIRITGQLVSVFDGYHLWSDQYDRELEDVFAIQEEIAENIVQALQVSLDGKGMPVIGRIPTRNVHAYDFYLRGRKFFYQSKRKGMEFACEMFAKAIETDPNYALAYAGLADCHSFFCLYFGGGDEHRNKAVEASGTALSLDNGLAEAHAARGLALSVNGGHRQAEKEFERAIDLDPKLFEAYYFYARMAFARGNKEKAIEMYHRAGEVNPDDYLAPSLEAFTYRTMNRMDESKEAYRRSLAAIRKHVELHPDDSHAIFLGALALLDLDERSKALLWVRRAQAIDPGDPYLLYGMGCFYCRIGDTDVGFRYLEKAVETGFAHKEWIDQDIDLDSVRDHPRFKKLLQLIP